MEKRTRIRTLAFISGAIIIVIVVLVSLFKAPSSPVADRISTLAISDRTTQRLSHLNLFIGTTKGGHTLPGPTIPFGFVKAGPDVQSEDNQAGYVGDNSSVWGFSPLHDEGTGGAASLSNFKIMPMTADVCHGKLSDCPTHENDRVAPRVEGSEEASPGFFKMELATGIQVEITASRRTALYRMTYHGANSTDKVDPNKAHYLLFDLSFDAPRTFQTGETTVALKGSRIKAEGSYRPSFGEGGYKAFMCMDLRPSSKPTSLQPGDGIKNVSLFTADKQVFTAQLGDAQSFDGNHQKTVVEFTSADEVLYVRQGVSFISIDQACKNAEEEIPDFDFEKTEVATKEAWSEALAPLTVDTRGVSENTTTVFWSGVYRAMVSPINTTGENPLWESTEPYWDSFYCIWDSFRAQHPLLNIIHPVAQSEMVRALIDMYRHEGWMPDCRMQLCKGWTQGGTNADVVLADSYVKGVHLGINWTDGYAALLKDAEEESWNWNLQGRGNLNSYRNLGYVPNDDNNDSPGWGTRTRSASRSLEYHYNDFCVAQVAKGLNKTDDAIKYYNRSGNWRNLYHDDLEDTGYKGFIQPRKMDGSWAFQDPKRCSPALEPLSCFLNYAGGEFYEASAWEYTFLAANGDMAALITRMGGPDLFSQRLDTMFENRYHDIGDEPGYLPCWMYNYAGKPSKTVDRTRDIFTRYFNTTHNGIPGNDDSGAMGAYTTFHLLGFYPVAGQDVYLISSPSFPSWAIKNPITGKMAYFKTKNFAPKNIYVQSLTLNGQPYDKNWFSHDFFTNGGTFEFTLGPYPSMWGTNARSLPPSIMTGDYL